MKDVYTPNIDLNLFPQRVVSLLYPFETKSLLNQINNIYKTTPNHIRNYPKNLTYQTSMNLFKEHKIFHHLENFIKSSCQKHYNSIYEVENSWCNIGYQNSSTPFHNHEPCDLAGVFYLQFPLNGGELYIHNNYDPIEAHSFQPDENSIFIFNGKQFHSTSPNLNTSPKIVIAFNLRKIE